MTRLALCALVVAVVGCTAQADSTADRYAVEFKLSDGTRCVRLGERAISCDWHAVVCDSQHGITYP